MQRLDVFDELQLATKANVLSVFKDAQHFKLIFVCFQETFGAGDDFDAAGAAARGAAAKRHVGVWVFIRDVDEARGSAHTDFELCGVESNLRHIRNLAPSGPRVHAKAPKYTPK